MYSWWQWPLHPASSPDSQASYSRLNGVSVRWTSTLMANLWSLLLRVGGTAASLYWLHFGLLSSAFVLFALAFRRSNLPGAVWLLLPAACSPAILNFIGVLGGCRAGCQPGVLLRLRRAVACCSSGADHNAARRARSKLLCSWRQAQCSARLAPAALALVATLLRAAGMASERRHGHARHHRDGSVVGRRPARFVPAP